LAALLKGPGLLSDAAQTTSLPRGAD